MAAVAAAAAERELREREHEHESRTHFTRRGTNSAGPDGTHPDAAHDLRGSLHRHDDVSIFPQGYVSSSARDAGNASTSQQQQPGQPSAWGGAAPPPISVGKQHEDALPDDEAVTLMKKIYTYDLLGEMTGALQGGLRGACPSPKRPAAPLSNPLVHSQGTGLGPLTRPPSAHESCMHHLSFRLHLRTSRYQPSAGGRGGGGICTGCPASLDLDDTPACPWHPPTQIAPRIMPCVRFPAVQRTTPTGENTSTGS